MTKKDAYIWYSGATDVTGGNLAKELKIDGGRDKPKGKKIVIGWGTKTKEDTTFPAGAHVLNHPDNIRRNRNKLGTLETMKNANVAVAAFVMAGQVMKAIDDKKSEIALPLVGRTKYHQGGKGFWTCLTKTHVKNAIDEGAEYFQNYIDIVDEYRLHVFNGKLLYAQKKAKRNNMEEAFVEQHADKIKNYAEKAEKKLDKETLDYALGRLAKENQHADMIVRSNRRGWKFSAVKQTDVNLLEAAKAALAAIGMEFGAVDCCIDADKKSWVLEVNSGPGLDGSTLKAYVQAFEDSLKNILNPPKKVEVKPEAEKATAPKQESASKLKSGSAKQRLTGLKELLDLVESADEVEAMAVESLIRKRMSAGA